jgi:hypothetical protein
VQRGHTAEVKGFHRGVRFHSFRNRNNASVSEPVICFSNKEMRQNCGKKTTQKLKQKHQLNI